jgi:Coenzyme PQQ synthesis protein D (PqqD)
MRRRLFRLQSRGHRGLPSFAVPRRVGQIFDVLAERHDVDAATLARDVTPFLQALVEYRLVRMTGASERP